MKFNQLSYSLLFFLLFLLTPLRGTAQPQGLIVAIDNSVFVAMLDPKIDECITTQRKDNWCWAACVQMAMLYCDEYVSQSSIASRVLGSDYNLTASGNEIASALSGWRGVRFRSFTSKSLQSFIDELSKGHPLIVGINEHAYLLTHIYYRRYADGRLSPFKVILINPKSGKEEVKDWNSFYSGLNTIISVS